ncbi:hypothetical protein BBO99_00006317 [Phytophthora kernoviae]|uniref:Lipase maturation factor 2 n=2 Tax=Phytophthora kernoviae TaxID=325452 RepID=A0A3R7IL25_9STRA|nr:hypothetical protein G195_007030 [Phytophthora kernoviae 00238/432]KAG2520569.1 hypothetical protein JM16_006665 [Phytophthora kernoviae]KAG2521671.1 hypothetical protein JM18_005872 [Phytophthora kernoviae]RLN31501.1 hypothetical protein BBI17_006459 [Phytophthora kernoviae]RLN77977.1 hypothetical protein BBO99_00006317 [Phytophthora kernoviae]
MQRFPRDFFLIGVCIVYATAFASLRSQIRGLYGEDGLEPVDVFLRSVKRRCNGPDNASTLYWIVQYPTLVWLHEPLQWTPSFCMEVICLVGTTVAILGAIQPAYRTAGPMALLWFCYLSIVQCGQTFLQFQWDSLLLEVGVLATLLAPWWHCSVVDEIFETSSAAVWTLRFMFFKFMLMSGAVKIQSGCPTWLGLSALDFHYATQPLPLSLSWYALQAPPIINRLAVAVTLLIEGPWTFLLLAPHATLRRVGAVQQIALQISIILTGNYNFFNILTIVLAAALIDVDSTANSAVCRGRDERVPYRATNAYGLFRTMTGVGTVQLENGHRFSVVARPEIILEGTKDGGVTWKAYHFKYKPGEVTATPRLVAPFHPRLDWQMWFAALGDYQGAPWLVHLVAKLLEGSHDVKELLDTTQDPFVDGPPDAIRAQLYYYDFTRLNTSWNRAIPTAKILEDDSDAQWWTRTLASSYLLDKNFCG